MSGTRRIFTDEFKKEAVALLVSSGRPLSQIAKELGVGPSVLRHWRGQAQLSGGLEQLPNKQATAPLTTEAAAAEISRLKKEIDHLRTERDILKKTVCIFSAGLK
jgi:transposase